MTEEALLYQAPGLGPSTTPLPHLFYVFVNEQAGGQVHPSGTTLVQHNLKVAQGRLFSASLMAILDMGEDHRQRYIAGDLHWQMDLTDDPNFGGPLSPFALRRLGRRPDGQPSASFQLELDAERWRSSRHGQMPSRLAGLFAFGSLEECHEAAARHGWSLDEVRAFRPGAVFRAARLDMEIVSLAEALYGKGTVHQSVSEQLWEAYWNGDIAERVGPSLGVSASPAPLWEWLIDGDLLPEDP